MQLNLVCYIYIPTLLCLPVGTSDFEIFQPIHIENSADIRLFTTNDEVTLEYNDTVILRFTPQMSDLVPSVEGMGEYIRDTATVNIIDNDRKYINPLI